jgi:hypothetical protein
VTQVATEVQRWALARDRSAVIDVDWSDVDREIQEHVFQVDSIAGGAAQLCVHLRWIERAHNDRYSMERVAITTSTRAIKISRLNGGARGQDDCSGSS